MWTALATIASALIGGLATWFGTRKTNQTSEDISNKNIEFQQQENDITRLREDNAVQRSAVDMQAAGLSKTLAAGNPASAASLTAPQDTRHYESPMQKAIEKMNLKQTIMDLRSQKADIEYKETQKKLIDAQTHAQELSNQTFMENFHNEQNQKLLNMDLARANIASYEASTKLNTILGDYKAQEIESEIAYRIAQTDLTNENINKVKEEIKTEIWSRYKLSKEAELVVQDVVNAKLKEQQMKHDLNYSQKYGLPVGKMPAGSWISDAITLYNMLTNNNSRPNSFLFDPTVPNSYYLQTGTLPQPI